MSQEIDRLTDQAAGIRLELVLLNIGAYKPAPHPARRDKLNARLRAIERKLLEHKQKRLL